jgi:hypothetical protein
MILSFLLVIELKYGNEKFEARLRIEAFQIKVNRGWKPLPQLSNRLWEQLPAANQYLTKKCPTKEESIC